MSTIAYLGSRTTRAREADGCGLTVWDTSDRRWRLHRTIDADATEERGTATLPANPSFALVSRDARTLYLAHGDTSLVSALDLSDPWDPTLRTTVSVGHGNPVHLTELDDRLVVTCLASPGRIVDVLLDSDSCLGEAVGVTEFAGPAGPMAIQRGGSGPHQALLHPSGRWLLVPDRGLDAIHVRPLGSGSAPASLRTRQGEGPRHLAVHPNGRWVYVVTELRSNVIACTFDPETGVLEARQVVAATPDSAVYDSCAAGIAVSPYGSSVVVSNRSGASDRVPPTTETDSVGLFSIEPDGRLGAGRWFASGGLRPRTLAFAPDGSLIVVHQWDGRVVRFDVAPDELTNPTLVAQTGTTTCVAWREGLA